VFRHGRVFVDDAPERGVSFHELAARAVATLGHPVVGEMTTTAEEPEVTAYCAQVAEVEVDPDTGQVTVHRIVTAHDVGTIINPLDHQGQIDGAVIQGLGYALMEGLHADEGRISTLSLGEAKIPTMQDIPTLVTVLVASPGGEGPFQGKAIGENPISPVAPAIANAVDDAVGVRIQDLPITARKGARRSQAIGFPGVREHACHAVDACSTAMGWRRRYTRPRRRRRREGCAVPLRPRPAHRTRSRAGARCGYGRRAARA
jgi:CO/xanthine dehydrogenase Mo-binding subunit